MDYPLEKYRYYVSGNKVNALSTYAGKCVRGVAKCAPEDKFNLEIGKQIAAAKCNEKVARKRRARAENCLNKAQVDFAKALVRLNEMKKYYTDADTALENAVWSRKELIANLKNI